MPPKATPRRVRRGNPNATPPKVAHRMSAWLSSAVYAWVRDRIVAAGGDPSQIPEENFPRFLRLPEVMRITGLKMTSVYGLAKANKFPKPIPLDARPQPPQAAA
jgi:predicted DNA-binding transcriptional regulator AlpA